jgi:hypothetical protein
MIMREGSMLIIIAILAGAALLSTVATKFLKLEDDNVAEEFVEDVIQDQTGLDLDLTPKSPEKK